MTEEKKKKEMNEWVSLAKQNLKEEKFRDALTCITSARKVASDKDTSSLDKLEAEVAKMSGVGTMFGAVEDKSDGKNVKLGKAKEAKQETTDDEEGGEE